MYYEIPGGSLTIIPNGDGWDFKCWLPPVGWGKNIVTGQLENIGVWERSKKKSEQYWEPRPLPKDYKSRRREEARRQEEERKRGVPEDKLYYDPVLIQHEQKEWQNRFCGCWFKNNGIDTYITQLHWFYLSHWSIDIGLPHYRDPDRKFFYAISYAIEDPFCFGINAAEKRRSGKTFKGGCFLYEDISRTAEVEGGIQSKTSPDAQHVVFKKAVVSPFKKLVEYFRPIFDTSKGITPVSELRFAHTTTKGKRALENLDKPELNSLIDWASSDIFGYDGRKKRRLLADEQGKNKEVDVYERHQVTRYCLETDGVITGKALYITTVEEMESGGKAYLRLWKASNAAIRDENGHTESGLYNFFTSALETLHFDRHGIPDIHKTREFFENRRRGLMHDPNALCAEIRKNPFTVAEMFIIDGESCMYNSMKLNEWRATLSWNQDIVERGNFEWKDGKRDTMVVWTPNKYGRWEIARGFNPDTKEVNNVEKRGNLFYPQNDYRFGSGVDPYDHDLTEDNRRSYGASIVKQKNNLNNHSDLLIGAYICRYKFRPQTAALLYEDMIKQCFYFSCQILFESNKPGIMHYFRARGYGAFLMHLPGYKEPGIPATPENKQSGSELVEAQIENNCEKVFFIDVIDDWLAMDLKKMQKFDLGAASLWTEMACHNRLIRNEPDQLRNIDEYMPPRKIPGRYSTYAIEPIDG